MGLQVSQRRGKVPSFLSALSQAYSVKYTFSLCLSDTTGIFLMGGQPPQSEADYRRPAVTLPFKRNAAALFSLNLVGISYVNVIDRVNDMPKSASANDSNLAYEKLGSFPGHYLQPAIVDSGTTFMYMSTPVYRAMHAAIYKFLPSPEGGPRVCSYMYDWQLNGLPRFRLMFEPEKGMAGERRTLIVRPRHYMVEFPRPGGPKTRGKHYCVVIFDNHHGGSVIGASILRDRETIFDLTESTVTFVDTDCSTASVESAHLRGAYRFDGCSKTTNATQQRVPTRTRKDVSGMSRAHAIHATKSMSPRARMAMAFNRFRQAAKEKLDSLARP